MSEPISLQSLRIEGRHRGPRLLIFGGVHGDEFEPMVAIRQLGSLIRPSELHGTLTLVPVVNEPAFLRGQRVADDGLDLARSFPGRPDGSITEQVAHAASELIRAADYFIDLHTGGSTMSVLPLVGYMLHADGQVLERQRQMARAFNLPIVWGTSPELDGRSLSVARDARIPAIYGEYQGAAVCSTEGVRAYVNGCLNVMSEIQMLDRPRQVDTSSIVVEDPRSESGHLQINNPSPMTGYFESTVRLGQYVAKGCLLGSVSDPLGAQIERIYARQSGVILVLRTFPRVLNGDCLAVILETNSSSCTVP